MTFIGLLWLTIAAGLLVGVRRHAFAVHVADTVGVSVLAAILLVAGALALGVGARDDGLKQIYVSSGVGFWGPPIRVFADAEIALLKLRKA